MKFLSLRNNRKLSHSWIENFRIAIYAAMIAISIILMIMAFHVPKPGLVGEDKVTSFHIQHLTTLFASMASIPITIFIVISMNKHQYVKIRHKHLFEIMYLLTIIALSTIFYLHMISVMMIQIALLASSVAIISISLLFGVSRLNYKASTTIGTLFVKPVSYDNKRSYAFVSFYLLLGQLFQGGVIAYYKFVPSDTKNYLVYQFLIIAISVLFYLLCMSIYSASRSLGQSQGVLYYRYAQVIIITIMFLAIGVGVYRTYVPIVSQKDLIDYISIGINGVPLILLFMDLFINARKTRKNKNYQGLTELKLLIKILAAIMFVLINLITTVEIKFFLTGQVQSNIDVTVISLAIIIVMIAIPYFIFWKKITKRSSRIFTLLSFLILAFMVYKFYFYADINNANSTIFDIPVESIYTMVTLLAILIVEIITLTLQAKNSGRAFRRYGNLVKKEVSDE